MKKILILLMGCNQQFFIDEFNYIKDKWLSFVDNYDNIDYYYYTTSYDSKYHINKNTHVI